MKSFVITILDLPESVVAAKRCIKSMPEYNVQMWEAYTPKDKPIEMMKDNGMTIDGFTEVYSKLENCLAAFLSHYKLWEMCVSSGEEFQIFEHDAVCVNNIPHFINYKGCISLGAPSYGKFNTPNIFGVNPLTSKRYFPGAHAYRLKPRGAIALIAQAQKLARPTDVFLNTDSFSWLEEYYPWPVIAKDSFTTIQNKNGCAAKHNYGENYEILRV